MSINKFYFGFNISCKLCNTSKTVSIPAYTKREAINTFEEILPILEHTKKSDDLRDVKCDGHYTLDHKHPSIQEIP